MKKLFLCGFMGAGKTTVGRLLADRLQRPFVDSDALIEHETGFRVAEFFEKKGEARFREVENEIIARILSGNEPVVAALGGGSLIDPVNLKKVVAAGTLIYLKTSLEELHRRLKGDSSRPLLAHASVRELFEVRRAGYESAQGTVVTDGFSPEEIADRIVRSFIT